MNYVKNYMGAIMSLFISRNKNVELTKGEEKVLEVLKKAYSETESNIVIYVQGTLSTKRADFIVIDSKLGISILEVKDWSEEYIKDVNKRKVILQDNECENPNMQVSGYKTILSSGIVSRDFDIDEEDISTVVIFTNMNENIKVNPKYNDLFKENTKYLFKSDLSKLDINKIFNNSCRGFTADDCNKIRIALFPELEIVNGELQINNTQDVKALDFEQEEFAKRIPYGHYMVTGIPGSGKTIILLARAVYLIKENPNWKILIMTYNRSLAFKIKSKLDKMAENFKNDINNKDINIDNIEVRHFHSETALLTKGIRKPDDVSLDLWFNEKIIEKASVNARPLYDAVLIDEYQDFYLNWIELCLKLCKTYEGKNGKPIKNVFLAGDRLQSIYNAKDVTWSSIGIDMRGRSKFLKTSYRSAKQHFNLALEFLKQDKTLKSEVDKYYVDDSNDNSLYSLNNGSVEFIRGNYNSIGERII
ncbi:MAG: UvrD-helicase domain-containing protein, partial [Clostridium sp.]